jgi:sarcosine oxidase subunit beta
MDKRNAQVIIIGAGAIGTACAYFLTRLGIKVLILERHHLASGASGASAALITVKGSHPTSDPLDILRFESHQLIRELQEDFDRPIEIVHEGSVNTISDEQEVTELRKYFEHLSETDNGFRFMEGEEAFRFEPLLSPDVKAIYFNPLDYHVNPFRLCEGYLHAALRRGAKVAYGADVIDVKIDSERVKRVITNQGYYDADWVVVAGGAHTPQILANTGMAVPISPARGQVVITEPCEKMTGRVLFLPDHLYIKQTVNGNFYLGSHTEFVGFDASITLEKIAAYSREFSRTVPLLSKLKAIRFFTGFRPLSADERPIIGPLPYCPRLIVASGHGRSGMCFSASTGKAVSELISTGKTTLPIEAFGIERFR